MSRHWDHASKKESFSDRHIGNNDANTKSMLKFLGYDSIDQLAIEAVPESIRNLAKFDLPEALTEADALSEIKSISNQNIVMRSLIGNGYFGTATPQPIKRNILQNPSWYTQYTPYQSEIAQGRLEALLNFQTMIMDLTGLEVANASLLDEATAAAEAMSMSFSMKKKDHSRKFLVSKKANPQTLAVLKTRAHFLDFELVVDNISSKSLEEKPFGILLQYPNTDGSIDDIESLVQNAKSKNITVSVATDLLALCLIKPPGDFGADIAIGSSQRFGIPLGYGGPHAGFIATKKGLERRLPGRIVGISKDSKDKAAYRLALATREQHIRRDKATSNICTSQVLLAIMAGMYAVYHGPKRLKEIAQRVNSLATILHSALKEKGYEVHTQPFFDTIKVTGANSEVFIKKAEAVGFNLRKFDDSTILIAIDELSSLKEIEGLANIFSCKVSSNLNETANLPTELLRTTSYLQHPVFNSYHCETDLMRYIKKLENRDLSLTHSMIPLGSCTMKLNAAAELEPITWDTINNIHPFAPKNQTKGYENLLDQLTTWLASITGFHAVSLQPNSGAQGEYAGLLVIRKYQEEQGETHRNICLIPSSAHGTNPASAAMLGLKVIVVNCDNEGNIDRDDFQEKLTKHAENLSSLMITYPSTHGVFEEGIKEICEMVHGAGGQVYMDGANLQAQISLCLAGEFGPDVCHMNLHKTFCIPHGGGGPGVGPIAVREHLTPYLPSHPAFNSERSKVGPVAAAPYGSASILPISWMYIRMMGYEGLSLATRTAILNANYMAKRLEPYYPIVYKGKGGLVAHECIIDLKVIKKETGIDENDIAKRLIDYGFHAPTVSWPVPLSMMIEPTESEPKAEIDRFCDALINIWKEIDKIKKGVWPKDDNPLKQAPHTAETVTADSWSHPYSRETAAFPLEYTRENKFWPHVNRVDNAFGDRNLVCACLPIEAYQD